MHVLLQFVCFSAYEKHKCSKCDWPLHKITHLILHINDPETASSIPAGKEASEGGNSLYNPHELEMVLLLCGKLWSKFGLQGSDAIGVISPYKAQVRKLQTKLREVSEDVAKNVEVNTIDGFQVGCNANDIFLVDDW